MSEMEGTNGTIEVNLKDRKILVRELKDSHIYTHEVIVQRAGKDYPVARVKALRYAVDLLPNLIADQPL